MPPQQIEPTKLGDYLEALTKSVFQSGISWKVVEAKWDGMRRGFAGFDPDAVARLGPEDVDRLMADTAMIRNRKKIEATVDNAVELIELDREHGGFRDYLRSHEGYDALVADLRKRFRFLGQTGAHTFLYTVGEEVPDVCDMRHERRSA